MKKVYFILIFVLFIGIGLAFAEPSFEFKTINPNYRQDYYQEPQSYNFYKKQQSVLLEDNVFSSPALKNLIPSKESKPTPSATKPINNYSVYSPKEYKPTNYTKEAILFIIDFSGSMQDKVAGKRKIDMAIDTMHNILPQLSPKSQLGLRIYGHRSSVTPIDSCLASDLIVPIAPNSAEKIYSALLSAKAKGNTPITYSLKQAVNKDFMGFTGKKRIILLTDGGENCDESPCTYAMNVLTQRQDISIDVIAFDINNSEADAQLKCTAMVTSGKFYKANTEAQLVKSLTNSLNIEKDVQGVILKTPK